MTLLGLDFDNTLVRYDRLFHQLAIEKGLIEESLPAEKLIIRDYLRSQGLDEQFTLLQGEVYGPRILEAQPAVGMLKTLVELNQRGVPMVLVSHKTKTPYKGPPYDLHNSALSWLQKYKFFDSSGLGWSVNQVFFEESKEAKVQRIQESRCTHYVDDLPEILSMLQGPVSKILYDPSNFYQQSRIARIANWNELINIIE